MTYPEIRLEEVWRHNSDNNRKFRIVNMSRSGTIIIEYENGVRDLLSTSELLANCELDVDAPTVTYSLPASSIQYGNQVRIDARLLAALQYRSERRRLRLARISK